MICEMRREEEGLLTVVGDRESWGKKKAEINYGTCRKDLKQFTALMYK